MSLLVRKSEIRKIVNQIRKLYEDGVIKKSDFTNWLKKKGVVVSPRTSWDEIINRIYEKRLSINELKRFLAKVSEEIEEVERITVEKIRRVKREAKVKAEGKVSIKERLRSATYTRLYDLILELYPGDPKYALENVMYILDEIGAKYRKTNSLGELISSLSYSAQERLYEELKSISEWRKFEDEVYNWIIANVREAALLKAEGVDLFKETYVKGASGLNYRLDIAVIAERRRFLSTERFLIVAECKKYTYPVKLDDIMIFKAKLEDILERYDYIFDYPRIMFFSASGYTDRAKTYATTWGVFHGKEEYPMELYERRGRDFILVAKTKTE